MMEIPQRHIFSLYSAILSTELLEFEKDLPVKTEPKAERRTGMKKILGKILNYVKSKEGEDL